MKILRYITLALALVAAVMVGCEELPTPGGSDTQLTVETTSLTLPAGAGTTSFDLTSNTSWTITSSAEWLQVIPASGSGSTKVRCAYQANTTAKGRNAKISIAPVDSLSAPSYTILVLQNGTSGGGSGDNGDNGGDNGDDNNDDNNDDDDDIADGNGEATSPYSASQLVEILTSGKAIPDTPRYVIGVISSIEEVSTSYGNATYYISNNGKSDTPQLCIYRGYYLGGEKFTSENQIAVGDEVVICGTPILYNDTKPEMDSGNYIHSIIKGSNNDDNGGDDNGDDNGGNGGTVTDGGTPHAGWAELPAEEDNSDYYYAYHMRADKGSQRNFSVCYSAEMGCPVWVAAPIHKCYCGSGRSENYAPDPVIPSSVQKNADKAGNTNKGNWMNRGHMLASNMRNVTAATNKQVFYYSNIAPQDGNGFNTGGGWWNDLEDIEKSQYMCSDTLYTVNGCHWANKNETFGNRVVPTHFYKVFLRTKKGNSGKWVVNCSESELQCVAFYAPHYHGDGGKTAPTSSHLMSVAELERITGHTFFPNVPNAPKDTFNPSDWGM